jgi:hypothetical protein
MRKYIFLVLIAAVSVVSAFFCGFALGNWQPSCPTEDSCVVDYHHGGYWTITRVTP